MRYRTRICVSLYVLSMSAALTVAADFDVTFFVTSDTHWGYPGTDVNNTAQIAALNGLPGTAYPPEIGGTVDTPAAVIVAGDLTEDGKQSEWDDFVAGYGLTGSDGVLNYPLLECAGNHDFHPAEPLVPAAIAARHGREVFGADFGPLYVASVGLYPDFANRTALEQNLAVVGFDRPLLLFHHYGYDPFGTNGWWSDSEREDFRKTIDGYNVIAICHGHTHAPAIYTWAGHRIYLSGAAKGVGSQNVFFVIRVTGETMTTALYRWTMDAAGQWNGGFWVDSDTQALSIPVPPSDCNGNGVPDNQDIADATSADANDNGYPDACEPEVLYVDRNATSGRNVGSGWEDAFTDLLDAIEIARLSAGRVREIWVAEGVYRPLRGTTERRRTYALVDGVALYGGFAGGETERDARDPSAHLTELNGEDASDPGNPVRVYHVVTATDTGDGTRLDGFTIRGGQADGEGTQRYGGGILVEGGTPTVANCVFTENTAHFGGGMGNIGASPVVTNCVFVGNTQSATGFGVARTGGAAISNTEDSAPIITNCTFRANTAEWNGGGLFNRNGNPILTNCILWANADRNGVLESSQIHNLIGAPIVTYSCVQDADPDDATIYPGTGNIDDDPLFVDAPAGNLRLSEGSPSIDSGLNTAPSLPATDADGNPRIANGTVDMGAYEAVATADVPMLSRPGMIGLGLWLLALAGVFIHLRRSETRPARA